MEPGVWSGEDEVQDTAGDNRDDAVDACASAAADLGLGAIRRDRAVADAVRAAEQSPVEAIQEIASELSTLRGAQERLYGSAPTVSGPDQLVSASLSASPTDRSAWLQRVRSAHDTISDARVPWRQKSVQQQRYQHQELLTQASSSAPAAVASAIDSALEATKRAASTAAAEVLNRFAPELQSLRSATGQAAEAVLPMHSGFNHSGWASWDGEPSGGRLVFEVGLLEPTSLVAALYSRNRRPPPDGQQARQGQEPEEFPTGTTGIEIPVLVDLDQHGGMYSYQPDLVRGLMLKALAAVPGGRFTTAVFDPQKLGDSVNFLFGLGDHAERVIGLKVKSTDRELNELLTELEEHLTFVTQKYLQGQFETLTEYNRAAGEIAEPYRALALFDYPYGFIKAGGHVDEDLLARFAKIVAAGPRCGVYPLVALADPLPQVSSSSVYDVLKPLAFVGPGTQWQEWRRIYGLLVGTEEESSISTPEPVSQVVNWPTLEQRKRIFVGDFQAKWSFKPDPFPDDAFVAAVLQAVERRLVATEDVRVDRTRVFTLYAQRLQKEASRDRRDALTPTAVGDPDTWWARSSEDSIVVPFGRSGASDVALLRLDSSTLSSGLVGGRPGAGKSVLFHSIVLGACQLYSPSELELFLVDFKEGVEFKVYAEQQLPHARVVAIESDREFGLSVLEELSGEIERRGSLFRESGGGDVNIGTYRQNTGKTLARQVLIIDEFHVLFERDDKIAGRAAELLDKIVRQGRAFGIHVLLGSQTLGGSAALGRHTLNQVPIRIALQCSEADSRLLLADDNVDARLLTRPGEGILNVASGRKEANQRFQAAWVTPEEREDAVRALRSKAHQAGHTRRPIVFEGNVAAALGEAGIDDLRGALAGNGLSAVPLGLPLSLGAPLMAPLRRQPGGNLLVVGDEEDAAPLAAIAAATAVLTHSRVVVLDFLAAGNLLDSALESMAAEGSIEVLRRRAALDELSRILKDVEERRDLDDAKAGTQLVLLNGLHRARDLEPSYDSEGPAGVLEALLRDGPDFGVHVIATCDKVVSLERRLSRAALREFAMRVAFRMGGEDSIGFLDSDIASQLRGSQAVFDDQDEALTVKFRPWRMPTLDELSNLAAHTSPTKKPRTSPTKKSR